METRALCIAFCYAIGTAAGGIAGPLLFGKLIQQAVDGGEGISAITLGYYLGGALMIMGGITAAFLGVKAEGQSLESIARPLTAEDDDADPSGRRDDDRAPPARLITRLREESTMPMPPPKASTEGPRDRQVFHEMGQVVRALEANGPQRPDDLAGVVGAAYWESGRFDRALAYAVSDGLVFRTADGTVSASG